MKDRRNAGFTLIESIIVVALIGLLTSAVSGFYVQSMATFRSGSVAQLVQSDLRHAMNYMVRELQQASNVSLVSSNHLAYTIDGSDRNFRQDGNTIRRHDNQPLSQYVDTLEFFVDDNLVEITITSVSSVDGRPPEAGLPFVLRTSVALRNWFVPSGGGGDPGAPGDPGGGESSSFASWVIDERVFVYGTVYSFAGNITTGLNATIVVTGSLSTPDFNGGAATNVTTIYIDGSLSMNHGSASFGSQAAPGNIYVNGNAELWSGNRNVYGNLHVNGNFRLKDARIHGNVYVNGDVELGWTPWLSAESRIYYTGELTHPPSYSAAILGKLIKVDSVEPFVVPNMSIPSPHPDPLWYSSRGYVSSGTLVHDLKIFAPSYSSTVWRPSADNVIIVATDGDITITGLGGSTLSGILFAPRGKVTFSGARFTGLVIARDGFFVTSGGTNVIFQNMDLFIPNPADYPF